MRKFTRYSLAVLAVSVTALALTGCVIIKSNSSAQLDGIGSVQITTTFCASDINSNNAGYSPADSNCQGSSKGGNSGLDATSSSQAQLLVGYRIPTTATAPNAITTTNPSGSGALTFNQSSSYTSQLQSKSPAPSGEKWVGYLSDPATYSTAGNQYFTLAPEFALQQEADGAPFQGPFKYRVVVGWRVFNGSYPASRPVVCGSTLTTTFDDGPGNMDCADSPSTASIPNDLQQATQDLGVLEAPGPQSVNQGNVARVKFQVDYAGDGNQAPDFDLSASTDIPGASALASTPTLTPDDGTTQLRVIMRVPVDTPAGAYDVTLTASLPNGETRSSTHEVLVTPTTVRCNASAPTIAGTRGDDILIGTPGPDVIAGYAGDDEVLGLDGNDLICTGRGDDTIRGGGGNDQIAGRRGNDLLTGGSGHNVIDPGPGKDRFIQ
jgi:Ca2+-binding RTX toxin-like protein